MGNKLTRNGVRNRPASVSSAQRFTRRTSEPPFQVRILDEILAEGLISERKRLGIDLYDEVWDGVYVMPSMPILPHQKLVHDLEGVLDVVLEAAGGGEIYPGANVSDRRAGWKENFRVPDIVVVLKNSRAINCRTHLYGGPDFLVEIESPGDDTENKIPFYSKIQVSELLIVERDTRHLRLLRYDGHALVEVGRANADTQQWLASKVLPLAFRWKLTKAGPRIEIKRTDGKRKKWTV
jgi:Uma2 family endonuclease